MKNINKLLLTLLAAAPLAASAQTVAEWDFSTAVEGSALTEVNGSVGAGSNQFVGSDFGASEVTADGVFRFDYTSSTAVDSVASSGISTNNASEAWLQVDIAGWNVDVTKDSQMMLNFGDSGGSASTMFSLRITGGEFVLEAASVDGGFSYPDLMTLDASSTAGLSIALGFDLVAKTVDFFYFDANGNWVTLATDVMAHSTRLADTFRIRSYGSGFGGDDGAGNDYYIDFTSITVSESSAIPELSSFSLFLGLASVGLIAARRSKRSRI
jgi:hypothetical protein